MFLTQCSNALVPRYAVIHMPAKFHVQVRTLQFGYPEQSRHQKLAPNSECNSNGLLPTTVKYDELKSTPRGNLERISRAIISADIALVSMMLAAFSNPFT
ncbi:unnamed protein product [Fraxinus pennsylvanica]|uniref:Uncharacterized protein n=1 Tax=Fraxinus pennsylvanica TaxID=56036 RepID=A0AAD2DLH3_9LAMI|nr:unnamed protein product [Fraxinus pennsylvanica]